MRMNLLASAAFVILRRGKGGGVGWDEGCGWGGGQLHACKNVRKGLIVFWINKTNMSTKHSFAISLAVNQLFA